MAFFISEAIKQQLPFHARQKNLVPGLKAGPAIDKAEAMDKMHLYGRM